MSTNRRIRWCLTTVLAFIFLIAAGTPPVFASGNYLNGADYQALADSERTLVVEALWDMHSFLADNMRSFVNSASVAELDRYDRCTSSLSAGQLRDMLDNYIASDSATRGYNLASDFAAMLRL